MYAMGNEIIRTDLNGRSFQTIASNIDPMDVDFFAAHNKIYWTDPINYKVDNGAYIRYYLQRGFVCVYVWEGVFLIIALDNS